jgi:hypothetical protein
MYHKLLFAVVLLTLVAVRASVSTAVAFIVTYFELVAISFLQHRSILRRSLHPLGLTVSSFRYHPGFVSWDSAPVWWQWREVYAGTATDSTGNSNEYSFWISGPFFTLFAQQYGVRVNGHEKSET